MGDGNFLATRNERFLALMRGGEDPEAVMTALNLRPADFRCLRKWAIETGRLPQDCQTILTCIERDKLAAIEHAAKRSSRQENRLTVGRMLCEGNGREQIMEATGLSLTQFYRDRAWHIENGSIALPAVPERPAKPERRHREAATLLRGQIQSWPVMAADAFSPFKQKAAE